MRGGRGVAAGLLGLALAGCGFGGGGPPKGGCDVAVQNVAAFSGATPEDGVEARAFGPDCRRAVMTLTVRDRNGEALWAYATPYAAFFAQSLDPNVIVPRADIEERLASWVNVDVDTTAALPEWPETAASLAAARPTARESTPLARDAYEALRAAGKSRLCYDARIDAIECVAFDPQTKSVAVVYSAGL